MPKQSSIAIVGSGPMAIYFLKHLIRFDSPLRITIFERDAVPGSGMPYRQGMNADYMLSNIFSREIPTIHEPLADWLRSRPAGELDRWNVSPEAISARAFYPRTLLGECLRAQLDVLVAVGLDAGHAVIVKAQHSVLDVKPGKDLVSIVTRTPEGRSKKEFTHVILATGHTWDEEPREGDALLVSPWPASNIAALPADQISILGSALSAVDVATALAHEHGCFTDTASGLTWKARPKHKGLHITMVSKTGILPEADFYYAYPYEPLTHLTEDAIQDIVRDRAGQVLERVFNLMIAEIRSCDSGYIDDLSMLE